MVLVLITIPIVVLFLGILQYNFLFIQEPKKIYNHHRKTIEDSYHAICNVDKKFCEDVNNNDKIKFYVSSSPSILLFILDTLYPQPSLSGSANFKDNKWSITLPHHVFNQYVEALPIVLYHETLHTKISNATLYRAALSTAIITFFCV
ncbi:MAG: hypothetical protein EAZ74_03670 [Alphaproteobacteria bacterium]|nr:MAG: hypothetical protein EAY76_06410 [Alphaproteobacteria bacterium]TAF14586.1 MAG: hypothetical protein EAZ74_03670 [Alphaproteobacteria bacterium]TAF74822.1 MAG: hypothetical protein EAZ52_08145 [Alphaproteobacteria bacterium]